MDEKENDVTNTNVSTNVTILLQFCAVWVKIITRTSFTRLIFSH